MGNNAMQNTTQKTNIGTQNIDISAVLLLSFVSMCKIG